MQTTQKYQLNKPEPTDNALITPLAENMDKVENALIDVEKMAWDFDNLVGVSSDTYTVTKSGSSTEPVYTEKIGKATRTTKIFANGNIEQQIYLPLEQRTVTKVIKRSGDGFVIEVTR